MKITHMTVESTKGWANIARREVAGKAVIGIRGDGAAGIFDLNVDTRDERSQRYAVRLHALVRQIVRRSACHCARLVMNP
jgi:hypothetical protein